MADLQGAGGGVAPPQKGKTRGRTTPPPVREQSALPPDPVSAAANPAYILGNPDVSAFREAMQSNQQKELDQERKKKQADQQAAQAAHDELIRRYNTEFSPQRAAVLDHAGSSVDVHNKDATTLLLNSVGYTGNSMKDLNAKVKRIDSVFQDVMGHPPTPGLIMDLLRAPEADDPQTLKNLLTGKADNSFTQADALMQRHRGGLGAGDVGEEKGLASALRASLYGGTEKPLFAAVSAIYGQKEQAQYTERLLTGDPQAREQFASMLPSLPVPNAFRVINQIAERNNLTINDFAGKTWQQNQRTLMDATSGSTNPADRLNQKLLGNSVLVMKDMQQKLNKRYGLGLKVTGIPDDSWLKAISQISNTRSYRLMLAVTDALHAGFGNSNLDVFNSINQSGDGFAPNSDGRAANDALHQFVAAQHGQSTFIKGTPWLQQFGAAMPLHWFNNGGFNFGSGLGWVFSGNDSSFQWNPVDVVTNAMAIPEHALFRGGETGFNAMNGVWAQGKTLAYAGESFISLSPGSFNESNLREAAKRLRENPTWLDMLGSPGRHFAQEHPTIDAVTNMLGDIVLARKFGSPGETMKYSDWVKAANDSKNLNDVTALRALVDRSAYASERVKQAYDYGRKGGFHRALERLSGVHQGSTSIETGQAYMGKNWVPDPESPWGDQFKLKTGETFRPLAEGEPVPADAMRWHEMLKNDLIDQATHENMTAYEVGRLRVLHNWYAPRVPARSQALWHPIQRFGLRGRGPRVAGVKILSTPHPVAFAKGQLWRHVSETMDWADRSLHKTDIPGTNYLDWIARNLRTGFTKAPNPHFVPNVAADTHNIFRMGLNYGLRTDYAQKLEELFVQGVADDDPALMMKVENELKKAAEKQGRDASSFGPGNAFAAFAEKGDQPELMTMRNAAHKILTDGSEEDKAMLQKVLEIKHEHAIEGASEADKSVHEALGPTLDLLKDKPGPTIESERQSGISVPTGLNPKSAGPMPALAYMNSSLGRMSLRQREALLVTDPVLFEKHGLTDSLRRFYAEGPKAAVLSPVYKKELFSHLAENSAAKIKYDTIRNIRKNGEWRYNMEGVKGGELGPFWTGDAKLHGSRLAQALSGRGVIGKPMAWNMRMVHEAASYIDRRLMSGAYQGWKVDGKNGVLKWFLESKEGQRLAEEEGMPGEASGLLAHMVAENLDNIELNAPGFLREAEQIRLKAKDPRKAIASYIRKNDINIPVTGHVSSNKLFNLGLQGFDEWSNKWVGRWLTANKWNREGLFTDMTAKLFHDYRKGASDTDALNAAMAQAGQISRHHMLDLADALKIEQNIRWGALFFTKHRLYWTWLMQTMRRDPGLAVVVNDFEQQIQKHTDDQGGTPGSFSFSLPFKIPGTIPPGIPVNGLDSGKTEITVPIARLLWLTEASNNPGALSNAIHAFATSSGSVGTRLQDIIPGRGPIELTTLDSTFNQIYLAYKFWNGDIKTSAGIIQSMSPSDQLSFEGTLARVKAGYLADHHVYPDDHTATTIALKHMIVTSAWRSTAFTGSYIDDPRMTNEQDKVWRKYNLTGDPRKREALRQKNPWIDVMLGAYRPSPKQQTLTNEYFDRWNAVRAAHEHRQEFLLKDARTNPENVGVDLFGKAWNAESERYAKATKGLLGDAQKAGAKDFVHYFNSDHTANAYTILSGQLHNMYGLSKKESLKIAKEARPPWVNAIRNEIYGKNAPLSDAAIAALPVDEQQAAQETQVNKKKMIAPYFSEPTTKVEKIRDKYFSTVYDSWVKERSNFFKKVNTSPSAGPDSQAHGFDLMRQWYDSQDHPSTIGGIEFPSAVRTHFTMLPKPAQEQYVRGLMTKQWGWLSRFDKSLLGEKVPETVQNGWTYYSNTLFDTISGPKGTIHAAGIHPTVGTTVAIQYASIVDKTYPGFFKDYMRSWQPTYVTLAQQKVGSNPGAQSAWKSWIGRVGQFANYLAAVGGAPVADYSKASQNPYAIAAYDTALNSQKVTDLLDTGRQGVLGGVPLAAGKNSYFYQLAMSQPNRAFQNEVKQWVTSDPNFIVKLFGRGA